MGNILDELVTERIATKLAEGCEYHKDRFISEDGHCLKCEDLEGDIYV